METFEELRGENNGTLLVISHQERILSIADEIVVIGAGRVKSAGPREMILPTLLSEERTIPVSYTHLDVYKRQVRISSRTACSNQRMNITTLKK